MDSFDDIVLDDYNFNTDPNEQNNGTQPDITENSIEDLPTKSNKKLRLDENLLLDTKGIPLLKNESMHLKFKGKGHEDEDLKKLMTYYTVWANNLYPRLRFKDFSRRVVKQASKQRIKVMIREWQEEYKQRRQIRLDIERELNDDDDEEERNNNDQHQASGDESSDDDNQPLFFSLPTNPNSNI